MSIPQSGGGQIENMNQLSEYLESGCKSTKDWRIGTEHEKFGFDKSTLKPLPYEGSCSIKSMLEGLRDTFDWTPVYEQDNLIGLEKNGANVSLEPGGQLELSGAPLESIHQTCDEANLHLKEVKQIADKIGAGFLGLGAAPIWSHDDMHMMPKGRYRLMTDYMDQVGTHGKQMMYRTCTIQVNLDFGSEADMVKKMRVGLALQPVATALFANSPFFDGKVNGHKSWRSRIWRDLDQDRTGTLPFFFEDGMGFQRYVDYALDVPMYFVYRDGRYIDALGQSFRDFINGCLPALPGELPTMSDWADHLTTCFPEARIKKFMEMRGADGGPWNRICALPAFWVGLMYDNNSLDAAWDICKDWNLETREEMRLKVSVDGLNARVGNIEIIDLASNILSVSNAGLISRSKLGGGGYDETHFLSALQESIETGKTPADELLDKYNGDWNGNLNKIYSEFSY